MSTIAFAGCKLVRPISASGAPRRFAIRSPFALPSPYTARYTSVLCAAMGTLTADAMDPVQKRLMLEDECILVDESDGVVGHDSKYNCVRNAAQRKLYDELGIVAEDAPVDQFTCLGRILYKAPSDGKWGEHELDYLLFLVRDVSVQPNPEEVADVMYVNKEQLRELLKKADAGEEGVTLSPWFRLVVDNFLFDWWSKLDNGTLSAACKMEQIHKLC